jgi:hypothetical protein
VAVWQVWSISKLSETIARVTIDVDRSPPSDFAGSGAVEWNRAIPLSLGRIKRIVPLQDY